MKEARLSFISAPIPQQQTPQQQQYAMYRGSPRSASDSSVSTPLSAVTAPQSSLPGSAAASRSVSAAGSMSNFPPVLDTPIEGASLSIDYGFDVSPPTAMMEEMKKTGAGAATAVAAKGEELKTTQGASDAGRVQNQDQASTRRAVMGRAGVQKSFNLPSNEAFQHKTEDKKTLNTTALRAQASTSNLSIMSTVSSNHLNMFEDDVDEEEGLDAERIVGW
ncbi:hypothetical protein CPB84DRAFT_1852882 [Gymnopilus junonius]|uniref:Uncharacterized protein n=1 Tax=Gymnopilus junonius TaxID=109634 RepID=A0A9P5NA94_GYMJU|nr:hypothetical protein CPB84DRAFT_1852882 [Gymnopilus junonius]